MHVQVIGFAPPYEGLDGYFNTFRLGGTLALRLKPQDEVFLMDEKTKVVFGRAVVMAITVGKLKDMCQEHAAFNHRELNNSPEGAPERLLAYVQKLFGPHIAKPEKKTTVLYLRRINEQDGIDGSATLRQEAYR
jgi:hypothetical protein